MAQNLSFIESELKRVERAANQTTHQMELLEKAMANVMIAGAKGSGVPKLSTGGAGVQNVSRNALNNPYFNPSGSPLGGRSVVGSGVDTDKIKGITKEYDRLKSQLAQYSGQLELLMKAEQEQEAAARRFAAAKTEAAEQIMFMTIAEKDRQARIASKAASNQQVRDGLVQQNKTAITKQIEATNARIKAAKELAAAEKQAADKQTALMAGRTVSASSLAGGGGKGGTAAAPRFTQESITRLFPGARGENILSKAGESGFTAEDIKGVTEYANSYTQLQFAAQGADGVMKKLVLTTDRAGNVMTSTQKQFRSFFGAIRRNVTEMIKWSAATLVVWGAIRKLGELLEVAIENESQLASIAVILGEEHANLTDVFNSAAEAAAATGESIDGVLEGYVQAFRATGNIADETERAAASQALLTDALTLSKLSALTTAQAMDVLTGAMRQAGLDFHEGAILLDKWVAVSRVANVSIETLAESFAITATSASNAGLEWDELNGIIATLAESTTLSATESGNAIRAFISGFNTDTSVKELTKYGIAVSDSTGETRGFLDVMKEIAALFEQGIISEGELNKISRAIGGGARREAQVATTIKNLGRAQEVAAVSANAHGDAERALNVQLDTVQTSITKLNNSFQKLSRTMGSEGGVLDAAGTVLNIFVKMVDATATLTKNLGDMTPILAGMALVFAATSTQTRGLFATNLVAGAGNFVNRLTGGGRGLSVEEQRLQSGTGGGFVATGQTGQGLGTRAGNRLLGPGYGRNAGSLLGQGLAAGFTAVSAIKDLQQGNKAGAAGSIAGGIIGGLLSAGNPIGIVIGTAIGEAFANSMVNYKTEFSDIFGEIFDEIADPDDKEGKVDSEEAALSGIYAEFGLGNESLGKFFAQALAFGGNLGYAGAQVIGNATGGVQFGDARRGERETIYKEGLPGATITPAQIATYNTLGSDAANTAFDIKKDLEVLKGFDAESTPGEFKFSIVEQQSELLAKYGDELSAIEKEQAEVFRADAFSGDVSDKQLKDALDQIPKLQSILTKYEATFGDTLRSVDADIEDVVGSFDFWTKIVLDGSTEQIARLNALSDEYSILENARDKAIAEGSKKVYLGVDIEGTEEDERKILTFDEVDARQKAISEEAVLTSKVQERAINLEKIIIPTEVDLDLKESDFDAFLAEITRLQDQAFAGWWEEGLNLDFSAQDIEEGFAPFFLQLGKDGAGKYLEGFDQRFAGEAFENLVDRGEITPDVEDKDIGLQQLDISSGEFPAVMAEYQSLVSSIQGQLGAQGIEWNPNEETFAGLFTDYVAMPITADLTLLNIAMQELIDVNKDQLDGIYNLPTDASFYVPFSGYKEGFVNQGGGGGTSDALQGYIAGLSEEEESSRHPGGAYARTRGRFRVPIGPQQERTDEDREDYYRDAGGTGGQPGREGARLRRLTVGDRKREKPEEEPRFNLPAQLNPIDLIMRAVLGTASEESTTDPLDFLMRKALGFDTGNIKDVQEYFQNQGTPEAKPLFKGAETAGNIITDLTNLLKGLFGADGEDPTITTKLQIESTTNTIIQLDGQVIANAIKPYLLNDEVRYEGTAGAAVKRFVI